jgi:uncharacterized membrane-anchored protein YitT (DUF2179 family)
MPDRTLLSSTENKILLGFFLLICGVFYLHLANNVIEIYNAEVSSWQIEKLRIANGSPKSMWNACGIPPPVYIYLFWLQIFTNPLLFFLLRKPKFSNFAVSTIINSITFLSLLAWNKRTYEGYLINGSWLRESGYFEIQSHLTAFILAILLFAFVILQISILTRFGIEKFQAKISLR